MYIWYMIIIHRLFFGKFNYYFNKLESEWYLFAIYRYILYIAIYIFCWFEKWSTKMWSEHWVLSKVSEKQHLKSLHTIKPCVWIGWTLRDSGIMLTVQFNVKCVISGPRTSPDTTTQTETVFKHSPHLDQ